MRRRKEHLATKAERPHGLQLCRRCAAVQRLSNHLSDGQRRGQPGGLDAKQVNQAGDPMLRRTLHNTTQQSRLCTAQLCMLTGATTRQHPCNRELQESMLPFQGNQYRRLLACTTKSAPGCPGPASLGRIPAYAGTSCPSASPGQYLRIAAGIQPPGDRNSC